MGVKVRRALRAGAAGAAATAHLVGPIVEPAFASHGNAGPLYYWPGTPTQWNVCYDDLTSYGVTATDHGRGQVDQTDVDTTASCSSFRIVVNDEAYGEGWYGTATCMSWANYPLCYQARVRFDTVSLGKNVELWKKVGCHELGHVGYLGHRNNDDWTCMRQGDTGYLYFDGHDWASMNANY